jgi:hypothetical protein
LVRRIEWVPYAAGSNPIDSTHDPTIREYCRVERWGDSDRRLGKRNCSGFKCAALIHPATASRVCSVISNCTGRCVFFGHTPDEADRPLRRDRGHRAEVDQLALSAKTGICMIKSRRPIAVIRVLRKG